MKLLTVFTYTNGNFLHNLVFSILLSLQKLYQWTYVLIASLFFLVRMEECFFRDTYKNNYNGARNAVKEVQVWIRDHFMN